MINYKQALEILKKSAIKLKIAEIAVEKAVGLVSAQDVVSKIAIPSFNNSAMDGFALKSYDSKGASKKNPLKLPIVKTIEAGDEEGNIATDQKAVEIMTGAKMPKGFDAVIIVEKANIEIDEKGNRFLITDEEIAAKTNVRYIGEDSKIGDKIIDSGELITPNHLMALTAGGISHIKVKTMPRIAVIATGKEIADQYQKPLNEGQIYNSNSPYIISYLKQYGFEVNYYGIVKDDIADFHRVMDKIEADKCNIIISTGAVSMGKKDFIKEELIKRQAEILFHKVSIRPGKPILFALVNNSHFFGLPGNPISSVVGLQFFVMPFIQNSLQLKTNKTVTSILKNDVKVKAELLHFLKSYSYFEQGKLITEILDSQQSFKIKPLIKANSLAIIDGDKSYNKGDIIEISPLTNLLTNF